MKTEVVTGASGFIAQHLADALRRAGGSRVVGLDVRPMRGEQFDQSIITDLTDRAATTRAIGSSRPDTVYHLVGAIRGSDEFIHQSNVETTRILLEALRRDAPDARVVLVGSAAEYGVVPQSDQPVRESFVGRPTSTYGRAKREVTALAALAREFGQYVVVGRPFNVIGPGVPDTLVAGAVVSRVRAALAGPEPRSIKVGRTSSVRDFVAVEDVAAGLVRAAERGRAGESYNLCSGKEHSVAELVEHLLALAGVPIKIEQDESLVREGEVDAMIGSWEKAKRDLEWRPTISFEASLNALWRASGS